MSVFRPPDGKMPARIRKLLSMELANSQPMREVRLFVADPKARMLIFAGTCGTGKSVAAGWAMAEWTRIERRDAAEATRTIRPPIWTTSGDLVGGSDWHASEMVAHMVHPRMVVIDELGNEQNSDKASSMLQHIICARHNDDEKITVMTTNLAADVFIARFSDRVRSRVRESGVRPDGTTRWWIDCKGEDMRGAS